MSGILDQYDRERFKTVVNNEHIHIEKNIQYIIHIEKNLHKHVADKEFDEVFGQYSSINNIQRKQKECMEKQPNSVWYIGYIEMLYLYHELIRSIWFGDLELYIYCLP